MLRGAFTFKVVVICGAAIVCYAFVGSLATLIVTPRSTGYVEARHATSTPNFGLTESLSSHLTYAPPQRRIEFVYSTNAYQSVYDDSWMQGGYPPQSCWGCRFAVDVVSKISFHTVLDAGTGNGALVRLMRKHGKNAYGIELSQAVIEHECPDLLSQKLVEPGILTNLPYVDNSFDLVFSADALEHIDPSEADTVVRELVRVTRRHIFLSISLKGHTKASATNSSEASRHTMLRSREWWHDMFRKHGAIVNEALLWAFQEKDLSYERSEYRNCRWEGTSMTGKYEVCVVNNTTWLVGERQQENLRRERCITPSNGELEPWFFAFVKV